MLRIAVEQKTSFLGWDSLGFPLSEHEMAGLSGMATYVCNEELRGKGKRSGGRVLAGSGKRGFTVEEAAGVQFPFSSAVSCCRFGNALNHTAQPDHRQIKMSHDFQ